MRNLSLKTLQDANADRSPEWGPAGSTDPQFHFIELGGEVGELLNAFKKYLRAERGMVGGQRDLQNIKDELGDVVVCAALCASSLGLDLSECVISKFNKTSAKHSFRTYLLQEGPENA